MDVRFTSTARDHLLSTVVQLRDEDRGAAASFVHRLAGTLGDLGEDPDAGVELPSPRALSRAGEGFRFLYRVRGETVWILAVWPEDGAQ